MLCIEAALISIPEEFLQGCCVLFCHLERRQPRKPTPLRALSVTHSKTASHTGFGTSVSLPAASLRLYCTYRLASRRGFLGGSGLGRDALKAHDALRKQVLAPGQLGVSENLQVRKRSRRGRAKPLGSGVLTRLELQAATRFRVLAAV